MKFIKGFVFLLTTFSLVVFGNSSAWAKEKVFAVVDRVDHKRAGLVLDDQYFLMALNLKVHDKQGATTMYAIKQGSKIYYESDGDKVSEIWLLPENTERPAEIDD